MMMAVTTSPVAGRGQDCGRRLEGGIVGDGKAPVRGQVLGLAGCEVTVGDRE